MTLDPIHLTVEQAFQTHESVLLEHGGSTGLRALALLESAVAAPQAMFGGESVFGDLVDVAAAYLFYLCKNRAFVDGNKRVALASCLLFAQVNGLSTAPDSEQWEELVLEVAASRLDREETTGRLRKLVKLGAKPRKAAKHQPPARRTRSPRRR